MIGIFGIGFMLGTVDQMEVQAVGAFADDHAFLCQGDFRVGGLGEVGHEDVFPDGGPLGTFHILNVQNVLRKSFVENARLYFERDL